MQERRSKFNGPRRFSPRPQMSERKFIIGRQPIIESFSSDTNIEKILIQKNAQGEGLSEIKKAALDNNIPIQLVPIEKLNGMTKANHQGVLAFISMVKYMDLQEVIDFVVAKGETPLFMMLDGVTDVRNIGAISRSIHCCGAQALIIPDKGVGALNEEAFKSSAGALEHIQVIRVSSLLKAVDTLHLNGIQVFTSEMRADKNVHELDLTIPSCIIMGDEGRGVQPFLAKAADYFFKIPMATSFDSFNVSVAAGIILYEAMEAKNVQMKFKLTLEATASNLQIGYQDKILLIGSCFTENIGAKMQKHLFNVHENPHGILFNPMSVHNALRDYLECKQYVKEDLFELNELFNSWHHHSKFSDITSDAALSKINTSIKEAHIYLKEANQLVITLGSAWLYCLTALADGQQSLVVANNHKAPANWFEKRLMQSAELISLFQTLVKDLQSFNPGLQIIFTISPVRHLREGLVENNRSKSVLIQAVHDIIAKTDGTYYFPAYEYVIDDLRDYRFYAEDLVHPNYAATQYVWEKWVETFYAPHTQQIMKQVAELQLAIQHKPFNKKSIAHQAFLQNALAKAEGLFKSYPYLNLQEEISFFSAELANIA